MIERYKSTILYGLALAGLMLLLKWLEWRFIVLSYTLELYIGIIALLFTGLGIWLALKLSKPKVQTVVVEKKVYIEPQKSVSEEEIQKLGLSRRELEVLQLMASGLSNEEIAERLFLSVPTIKTHSSRLFEKMDVKRRTQAVEMGKRLRIIN